MALNTLRTPVRLTGGTRIKSSCPDDSTLLKGLPPSLRSVVGTRGPRLRFAPAPRLHVGCSSLEALKRLHEQSQEPPSQA